MKVATVCPRTPVAPGQLAAKRWSVAFAAALSNALAAGAFFFTTTTLMPLIVRDLRIHLALSTVPIAVGKLSYVLLLLPGGITVDRYGPRVCVLVGFAVLASVLAAYATFASSFGQIIAAHVALAAGASVCGVPVYSLFIAQWFESGIGLAMGLVLAGYSAAGTTLPAILSPIATDFGWRAAMAFMSLLLFGVGLPVAYFFLTEVDCFDDEDDDTENVLEDLVLESTPLLNSQASPPASSPLAHSHAAIAPNILSVKRADNTTWTFIGFALNYMLLQYAFGSFAENILFFLTLDRKFSLSLASLFFSSLNLASFSAKLIGGHLGDHFDRLMMASVTSTVTVGGCLCLFLGGGISVNGVPTLTTSPAALVAFSLLFGFGYGSSFNSLYVLIPSIFGRKNLGRIQSAMFGLGLLGNALGSIATGVLRSKYGTYDRPFLIASAMCAANVVVFNVTRISLGGTMEGFKALSSERESAVSFDMIADLHAQEIALQARIGGGPDSDKGSPLLLGSRLGSGFFGAAFRDSPSTDQFIFNSGDPWGSPKLTDSGSDDITAPLMPGVSALTLGAPAVASGNVAGHAGDATGFVAGSLGAAEVESGFPYVRDWSTNSLRRAQRRRIIHRTISGGGSTGSLGGILRSSSTLENMIGSGMLATSYEDVGYVGNVPTLSQTPRLPEDTTGTCSVESTGSAAQERSLPPQQRGSGSIRQLHATSSSPRLIPSD
jgi:MFS family permease